VIGTMLAMFLQGVTLHQGGVFWLGCRKSREPIICQSLLSFSSLRIRLALTFYKSWLLSPNRYDHREWRRMTLGVVWDLADSGFIFVRLTGRNYSIDGFRSHHLLRQREHLPMSSASTVT
jgi:hypothetical protein